MIVRLNPKTKRISLHLDHKAELAKHMASFRKATLTQSEDHLFGEHR